MPNSIRQKQVEAERSKRAFRGAKKPIMNTRFLDALAMAEQSGLLTGARARVLRGRMPKNLVDKAKANTGAKTDTELIELALAYVATADEYAEWLISRRGTIPKDVDLEY
jgi:hypothetical protein